jgi:predicted O-methyltransferase YrrM
MYSKVQLAFKYLSYHFSASGSKGHGIHSPFVFDLIKNVLNDKKEYSAYGKVETLRKKLLHDQRLLQVEDLGAGSSVSAPMQRSVASIAKHAVKPKKYGQLLYRIVQYYQPMTIIELGTSLGVTTSYLSLANPSSTIFTMEGAAAIAAIARQNFKTLELHNIKLIEGDFDYTLPAVLYQLPTVDLAFIDGNHRRLPTENYFHRVLEKVNNNSILVFDDIHWSREMELAWQYIKGHPAVRSSIDLFFVGIVLFRQEFKEKQDFKIRF